MPPPAQPSRLKTFFQNRVIALIAAQLSQGFTPQKIALAIALGFTLGIFPILGATTVLCALAGLCFRLNQPVIQLVNFLASAVQLATILLFVRLGERIMRAPLVSFSIPELLRQFHQSPKNFFANYGVTGLRGILAWSLVAPFLAAAIYYGLLPAMKNWRKSKNEVLCGAKMLSEFLNALWPVAIFAVVLMLVIWYVALRVNNLGIVDIAWAAAFAPIAIDYALVTHGDPARRGVCAGLATLWSLRLATHLYIRVLGHHPEEDVRYAKLREQWGKNLKPQALLFFELQAVLIVLLSAPFLLACLNPQPAISILEWVGVAVCVTAVAGEGLADWQLKQFRAVPENKGRICQKGLWNFSRHPNYFFEWLIWVGFFLFAWKSPGGCYTVLCPALMLFFLLRVTGIPMTEELSVKTKGEAYRQYQRTTSAFVPWFKKKDQPA
jgi:steroid 5-alpha reductase family enzyme/uncharacterized protein (DUF2062 family)